MNGKPILKIIVLLAIVAPVMVFATKAPAIEEVSSCISVAKICSDASGPGEPIMFTATVTNCGDDVLLNITCTDTPDVPLSGVPTSLGVGDSSVVTGSYVPITNPSTDTITCSGMGAQSGSPVIASSSATCSTIEGGCTLTPGYWKTHSKYGPAPYDETWARIGEDTDFFLSGMSYYQILWTNPARGNAYFILGHQYIGAKLNSFGASVPSSVQEVLIEAMKLFNMYTPAQIAVFRGDDIIRSRFITWAGVLDAYNNGIIGPGHCP